MNGDEGEHNGTERCSACKFYRMTSDAHGVCELVYPDGQRPYPIGRSATSYACVYFQTQPPIPTRTTEGDDAHEPMV